MTETQEKIQKLDQKTMAVLRPWFKDREEFYNFFYHLIQSEHLIEMEKPEQYEEKLKAVQFYRRLAVKRVVNEDPIFEEIIDDIFRKRTPIFKKTSNLWRKNVLLKYLIN